MASVLLVPPTPGPGGYDALEADFRIVATSAATSSGPHTTASDPSVADVILFVGTRAPLHRDVRAHPLARRYPRKVVVYDSSDWLIPFFPGIYPSLPPRFHDPVRTRAGHYLRYSDSTAVHYTDPDHTPDLLFTFRGAIDTHIIRSRLLSLRGPEGEIVDTSTAAGRGYGQEPAVYDAYKADYGQSLARARYILCPRGVGSSSMRIFEAMKAGRAPVIISDDWIAPEGIDWSACSLRVAERDVAKIRDTLMNDQPRAAARGRAARQAWEQAFSPEACFNTLAAQATAVLPMRWGRERFQRATMHLQLLTRPALRHSWPARWIRHRLTSARSK